MPKKIKHSMTFDGRFGLTVEEYVVFRRAFTTKELTHLTWLNWTDPYRNYPPGQSFTEERPARTKGIPLLQEEFDAKIRQ